MTEGDPKTVADLVAEGAGDTYPSHPYVGQMYVHIPDRCRSVWSGDRWVMLAEYPPDMDLVGLYRSYAMMTADEYRVVMMIVTAPDLIPLEKRAETYTLALAAFQRCAAILHPRRGAPPTGEMEEAGDVQPPI